MSPGASAVRHEQAAVAMSAEWGYRPSELADAHRSALNAPAVPPSFEHSLLRQALAGEEVFWRLLASKERALRDLLQRPSLPFEERRDARAELESVEWLSQQWREMQHNVRCLKDFGHWLDTPPSRHRLFAQYCRHAIPAEWDRSLRSHEPPLIFPSREKFAAHGEHCHLCRIQQQLAEGRRMRPAPDRLTWGERWALDFLTTFCGESLAAVCDPEPDRRDAVWSEAPPWRLVLPTGERSRRPDASQVEISTRLVGPANPDELELTVAAQYISRAERRAEAPRLIYPPPHGQKLTVSWRPTREDGQAFPLLVPAPAEPGRLLLRYAVRVVAPAGRTTLLSAPPSPVFVSALAVDL